MKTIKTTGFLVVFLFLSCKTAVYNESTIGLEPEPSKGDVENAFNTEEYDRIKENPFLSALQNPLSTFSIDVDKASYSNVRRFLNTGQLPPMEAVRIEEMINYFNYEYPQPEKDHPFSVYTEVSSCPWNSEHLLVHIGLCGKSLDYENLKPGNYVFLIDVSGSMDDPMKLPLVKKSLQFMLEKLQPFDKVAIVVYAGAAGMVLAPTSADERTKIESALERLSAGGSTAGGEGLQLAYTVAKDNFIPDGNNRVILCTDGDFNVGVSSTSELVRFIEGKRKDNIYLTICGFGMGNLKDGRLEQISGSGNGNYFYIDREDEAVKVFQKELLANMFTIARDVKIQVEFNPDKVNSYRLIGYENRMLMKEDFNDETKDAGELGAGHRVTALYEIIPAGVIPDAPKVDTLKYQKMKPVLAHQDEMMAIKLSYKPLSGDSSKLISMVVKEEVVNRRHVSGNFVLSAGIAEFGMLLRNSTYSGNASYDSAIDLVKNSLQTDNNDINELVELIRTAKKLSERVDK